ncbi:MAG: hypothetical protein ACRDF4_08160 [Rhabdochlamydiaceae bacterium]
MKKKPSERKRGTLDLVPIFLSRGTICNSNLFHLDLMIPTNVEALLNCNDPLEVRCDITHQLCSIFVEIWSLLGRSDVVEIFKENLKREEDMANLITQNTLIMIAESLAVGQ